MVFQRRVDIFLTNKTLKGNQNKHILSHLTRSLAVLIIMASILDVYVLWLIAYCDAFNKATADSVSSVSLFLEYGMMTWLVLWPCWRGLAGIKRPLAGIKRPPLALICERATLRRTVFAKAELLWEFTSRNNAAAENPVKACRSHTYL